MQLRHELGLDWIVTAVSQDTKINALLQCFLLKVSEPLLCEVASHFALFLASFDYCQRSDLKVSSVDFVCFTLSSSFLHLSLHQHGFFPLLEIALLLFELEFFVTFDDLNLSVLESFTYEHLKNWLTFDVEVKEAFLNIVQLDSFVVSFCFWDILCGWL